MYDTRIKYDGDISREEAVNLHKLLWNHMADMCKEHIVPKKSKAIEDLVITSSSVHNSCFLCAYSIRQSIRPEVKHMCDCCPAIWGKEEDETRCVKSDTIYERYRTLVSFASAGTATNKEWKELTQVCKDIANIQIREEC